MNEVETISKPVDYSIDPIVMVKWRVRVDKNRVGTEIFWAKPLGNKMLRLLNTSIADPGRFFYGLEVFEDEGEIIKKFNQQELDAHLQLMSAQGYRDGEVKVTRVGKEK